MNILNRYITGTFLLSYLICVITVLGFYIVIDLFESIHRFVKYVELHNGSLLSEITHFYFYRSPVILYALTPMICLMAAMFTITKMARSNELVPLKASGISMFRVIRPFVFFAFLVSLFMVFLQEAVIPVIAEEIVGTDKVRHSRKKFFSDLQNSDKQGRVFYIGRLYPVKKNMKKIRVTIFDRSQERLIAKEVIEAEDGYWKREDGKRYIVLERGNIFNYGQEGEIKITPIPKEGHLLETNLSLETLILPNKKNLDTMSFLQLLELRKKEPHSSDVLLVLHSHITVPLSNICLLFLGLPLILSKNNQNLFLGISICILASAAFYGINLGCLSLGYKEFLNPIFAAWFPITLFFSLGAGLTVVIST